MGYNSIIYDYYGYNDFITIMTNAMKRIIKEFKGSLKDTTAEEAVDLFLFRPVSFVIAMLIRRFPITPNHISFLSLISGIVSGIFFFFGDRKSFIYGGIFYLLCHIFDLLDGMIARMKKNGTPLGRIIDGWVDYITSIAAYIGITIGLTKGGFDLPLRPWYLMIMASIALAIHSGFIDYYRQQYLSGVVGKNNSINEDFQKFKLRYSNIKKRKGNYIEKLLLFTYLGYTKIQVTGTRDKTKTSRKKNTLTDRVLLVFWNTIGVSTHRTFLILSVFFYEPIVFFYYILGFANIMLLILYPIQWKIDKREYPIKNKYE